MSKMVRLPEKLHNLLEVAMGDFEQISVMDGYKIDMSSWHKPEYDETGELKVCYVCLGGSVMAGTLNIPNTLAVLPEAFPEWNADRLEALDSLRCGYIAAAYREIHNLGYWQDVEEAIPEYKWEIPVPQYEDDPDEWKATMYEIIKILRELDI